MDFRPNDASGAKTTQLNPSWQSKASKALQAEKTYQRELRDLNALLDVTRELGTTSALVPLLQKVESALRQVLDCERATVFLYNKTKDELFSLVATGEELISIPAKQGIAGETFQRGALINIADAYTDSRFNPTIDKKTGFRTHNLLTFPMRNYDGDTIGVLQALNKKGGAFTKLDEEHAADLGVMAGVALQRQMLLDAYAQKQRMDRELSLARDIQRQLLPRTNPEISGYAIAGWNQPADETSGDFYDYIPFQDGGLGILLADVMGHGIGPALIVSECRAVVRALALTSSDPAEILKQANRLLCADTASGRFVTTFLGVLDPEQQIVRFLSTGQGPLLHYQYQSGTCLEIPATTHPLGIVPAFDHRDCEIIALQPGDLFVLATDGFFEWFNPAGDQFGSERISLLIHQHRDDPPEEIIERLYDGVVDFGSGVPQSDDLTAVIIKRI